MTRTCVRCDHLEPIHELRLGQPCAGQMWIEAPDWWSQTAAEIGLVDHPAVKAMIPIDCLCTGFEPRAPWWVRLANKILEKLT